MLSARNAKLLLAAILLLALGCSIFWLLSQNGGGSTRRPAKAGFGTNLALDLRYTYDAAVFRPVDYDGTAEFPLELEGSDFNFYGKRIRGAGKILAREPGPILYDFVGSQHSEVFEFWYKLEPQGKPKYEDCTLQGRLGLHQNMVYLRTPESRGWPPYFPDSLRGDLQEDGSRSGGADTAYIEGWTLFGSEDLFFFYAIGPRQLSAAELESCTALINSMQFNAIGASEEPAKTDKEKAAEEEAAKEEAEGAKSGRREIIIPPRDGSAAPENSGTNDSGTNGSGTNDSGADKGGAN